MTHPINTRYIHNTPYHNTLSTHNTLNTPYNLTLSTHLTAHLSHCPSFQQPITPPLIHPPPPPPQVPQIVSAAVERVEGQLAVRVEKEVSLVRVRHEQQTERLKRELLELQGGHAEREARQKMAHAEEQAELDRYRYLSQVG